MQTSTIVIVIITLICTICVLGIFYWFVKRKNPPKISQTEEKKEIVERPASDEIDDPLN